MAAVCAMGSNNYGQLGDGTTTDRRWPIPVGSLTRIRAIAAGSYHALAVDLDGTVWAWGYNSYGQIGDGSTSNRSTPVRLTGLPPIIGVAAGEYHSLALDAESSVWA
jgi:alpha-tubulin suppressor-like RCC1 family protein